MTPWLTYRTVILDPIAQAFVDGNIQHDNRLEEQWRGVEWLISRNPDIGIPKDKLYPEKYAIFVVAKNVIANTRELWVLYSYDNNDVTVHAVEFGFF